MIIVIKTLAGKEINLDVEQSYTIEHVKELISNIEGIQPVNQRLVYSKMILEDGRTIGDYNIEEGAIIFLIIRLRDIGVFDKEHNESLGREWLNGK
jgi:hypothetical protein